MPIPLVVRLPNSCDATINLISGDLLCIIIMKKYTVLMVESSQIHVCSVARIEANIHLLTNVLSQFIFTCMGTPPITSSQLCPTIPNSLSECIY